MPIESGENFRFFFVASQKDNLCESHPAGIEVSISLEFQCKNLHLIRISICTVKIYNEKQGVSEQRNEIKGQCHKMVVEISTWSSSSGIN
jgi:hypothetical protein